MTFVTVSVNREQLTLLSQLLLAVVPGCTIHQNHDPMRAMQRLTNQKVDAIFADVDACSNMIELLSKQKEYTQICLLCGQNTSLPEEISIFDNVLSYPITEQKMRTALQKLSQGDSCSCDKIMFGDAYG